jgi:hypothetical protein
MSLPSLAAEKFETPMERTRPELTRRSMAAQVVESDGWSVGPLLPVTGQWI